MQFWLTAKETAFWYIATGFNQWYGYAYGNGNGHGIAGTLHSGGYGGSDSPLGKGGWGGVGIGRMRKVSSVREAYIKIILRTFFFSPRN